MTGPDVNRRKLAWLAAGLAGLASLAAAWMIITLAQADRLGEVAPTAALQWRATHGRALSALAEQEWASAQGEGAERLAGRALVASPLDVRSLRVLAWIAASRGDAGRAEALMRRAAARSQRDTASHLWMFYRRLEARDFVGAYAYADAAMRRAPNRSDIAALVVASAVTSPRATDALIDRLARRPSWFYAVMQRYGTDQDPSAAFQVLAALKERGVPLKPEDSSGVVARLFLAKRPQEAYLAWILLIPEAEQAALGNVYDGHFDQTPRRGPFYWKLGRPELAELATAAGREGRVLAVRHMGGGRPVLADQWIVLPPGQYRLEMAARVEDFALQPRLRWTVSCPDRLAPPLAVLLAGDTARGWRDKGVTFTVPPGDCQAQRLQLTAEPGPGPVRGWFDDVRIQPAGLSG